MFALAGIAVWLIVKNLPARQVAAGATEIFDAYGNSYSNGWRYFSDGTSISPDGKYYKSGALIWSPA